MRLLTALLTIALCPAASGQAKSPVFEVASVKPSASRNSGYHGVTMRGGPGSPDPGQIAYTNVSLITILRLAYDAQLFQIVGPDWLSTETYDISAKIPAGASKKDFNLMLANLLAERFHLVLHHETREAPGYVLTAGGTGSKLRETRVTDSANQEPPTNVPQKKDAKGFPILERPGVAMAMGMKPGAKSPTIYFTAKAQSLEGLVQMLSEELRCPVVDQTGLKGTYDYNFEFAPESGVPAAPPASAISDPAEESGPSVLTGVRQQLGLRLSPGKLPLDLLIIDAADKVPTAN